MARKKRTTRRSSTKKRRRTKRARFSWSKLFGGKKRRRSRKRGFPWGKILLSLLAVMVGYVAFLDFQVYRKFEGNRWSLPARVYARPLELYAGLHLDANRFANELKALGYRFVSSPRRAGEVSRNGRRFQLISRPFVFWDGLQDSQTLRVSFSDTHLQQLQDDRNGATLALTRLEPLASN